MYPFLYLFWGDMYLFLYPVEVGKSLDFMRFEEILEGEREA